MKHSLSVFILFAISLFNAQTLIPYRDKNLWGYSDESGNVKITPKYDSVSIFEAKYNERVRRFGIVSSKGKYGMTDENGKILLELKYKSIDVDRSDNSTFIIVQADNGKFGVYDYDALLIPEEFDRLEYIRNDCFLIGKNQKIGVYNSFGKMNIPIEYKQITYISNDSKEIKWMVSNEKETKYMTTPRTPEKERISFYEEGVPMGEKKNIDFAALEKLKAKYEIVSCDNYDKQKCIYRQNDKFGFYDFEINKKISPEFDDLKIKGIYKGKTYLAAKKNGKNILINESGKTLMPFDFDSIEERLDIFTFKKDGRKGFYFIETQKYTEPEYQEQLWGQFIRENDINLIPVYTDNPKDWFYIGSNGVLFKAK